MRLRVVRPRELGMVEDAEVVGGVLLRRRGVLCHFRCSIQLRLLGNDSKNRNSSPASDLYVKS